MNPKGKKFISLFLAFSIMMLPTSLYAKTRGAKLEIWNKDGRLTKGELIAVQEKSLLVLDTDGKDISIDISDILSIRVVKKKPKPGKGALKGLLIGGGGGALVCVIALYSENTIISNALGGAIVYGAVGALIGAISGAFGRGIKTIQIERMTDSEIQETLNYLRKNARVRDYK